MFVQYKCEMSAQVAEDKYNNLSIISSMIALIAVMLIIIIQSQLSYSDLEAKKFDLDSVTVGDFTIQMDISTDQFKHFQGNRFKDNSALSFKQHLLDQIQDTLEHYAYWKNNESIGSDYRAMMHIMGSLNKEGFTKDG